MANERKYLESMRPINESHIKKILNDSHHLAIEIDLGEVKKVCYLEEHQKLQPKEVKNLLTIFIIVINQPPERAKQYEVLENTRGNAEEYEARVWKKNASGELEVIMLGYRQKEQCFYSNDDDIQSKINQLRVCDLAGVVKSIRAELQQKVINYFRFLRFRPPSDYLQPGQPSYNNQTSGLTTTATTTTATTATTTTTTGGEGGDPDSDVTSQASATVNQQPNKKKKKKKRKQQVDNGVTTSFTPSATANDNTHNPAASATRTATTATTLAEGGMFGQQQGQGRNPAAADPASAANETVAGNDHGSDTGSDDGAGVGDFFSIERYEKRNTASPP